MVRFRKHYAILGLCSVYEFNPDSDCSIQHRQRRYIGQGRMQPLLATMTIGLLRRSVWQYQPNYSHYFYLAGFWIYDSLAHSNNSVCLPATRLHGHQSVDLTLVWFILHFICFWTAAGGEAKGFRRTSGWRSQTNACSSGWLRLFLGKNSHSWKLIAIVTIMVSFTLTGYFQSWIYWI